MKTTKTPLVWLAAAGLCAALGCTACFALGRSVPASDREVKLLAAEKMQAGMDRVKEYTAAEGLAPNPEDWFDTAMLGERLTGITTTLGILEAKRTTANSDMAALAVQLLTEAGVKPGDTVAAGFSGSFPALNLAVLSACDALEVECVYIPSIGASTYGANRPELTFAEMACRLADDGLIPAYPAAVSAGGQNDMGQDMDSAALQSVWEQLSAWPLVKIAEPDYLQNLALREQIYASAGKISCFVAVGGGIVTAGRGEAQLGQGVIQPNRVGPITEKSGLLERYCAAGVPCIELLNVKKLMADYDLPYDPEQLSAPGESNLYRMVSYPRFPAVIGILAAVFCLWQYRRADREKKRSGL